MATIIPFVPGDPEQIIEITIDDTPVVLRARYNSREDGGAGAWYLDAFERDGVTVVAFGVKLVLGTLLGQGYAHPLFSTGLFCVDNEGTGDDPRLQDLGSRVDLVHFTAADMVLGAADPL